jgi:hypothetical protein
MSDLYLNKTAVKKLLKIYEYFTGECAHDNWDCNYNRYNCTKCSFHHYEGNGFSRHLRLLELEGWHVVWEKLKYEQIEMYEEQVIAFMTNCTKAPAGIWMLTVENHIEIALQTIERLEDDK